MVELTAGEKHSITNKAHLFASELWKHDAAGYALEEFIREIGINEAKKYGFNKGFYFFERNICEMAESYDAPLESCMDLWEAEGEYMFKFDEFGNRPLTKDERYEMDMPDSTFDFAVGSDEYKAIVGRNLD